MCVCVAIDLRNVGKGGEGRGGEGTSDMRSIDQPANPFCSRNQANMNDKKIKKIFFSIFKFNSVHQFQLGSR